MRFDGGESGYFELEPVARLRKGIRLILVLNAVVFIVGQAANLGPAGILYPDRLFSDWQLYRLLTYGFLHGSFLHLALNMFALWIFGSELERIWGTRPFLVYYLCCLAGAGVFHVLIDPLVSETAAGVIGASGGVYGLVAAYGLLFARRRIYLLGLLPMRASTLALAFAGISLFSGIFQSEDGVAHFAHLGGMLSGVLLIYWKPLRHRLRMRMHRKRMDRYLQDSGPGERSREDIEKRVDEMLEKISRHGLESLSREERAFLDEASRYLRREKER